MFKIVPSATHERLLINNRVLKDVVNILAEALLYYGKEDPKVRNRVDEILKMVRDT